MKQSALTTVVIVWLAAASPAVMAAGWGSILNDTAIADFDDEDVRDFLAALKSAMEAPLPAAPVEWRSETTGASARIEVLGRPDVEGFDECRRVRTRATSRRHQGQPFTWTACQDLEGRWMLVAPR